MFLIFSWILLLLELFSDQGSLGSRNTPGLVDGEGPGWTAAPPPAPPSSGWASRLAVADPADRAAACCWAAAALASCWSCRPAATAVSEDEARSVAGLGHLNLGMPMRPSCWTAPGTCWTMAGIPGSPPTSTPPPIPSTAATERQSFNICQDLRYLSALDRLCKYNIQTGHLHVKWDRSETILLDSKMTNCSRWS